MSARAGDLGNLVGANEPERRLLVKLRIVHGPEMDKF